MRGLAGEGHVGGYGREGGMYGGYDYERGYGEPYGGREYGRMGGMGDWERGRGQDWGRGYGGPDWERGRTGYQGGMPGDWERGGPSGYGMGREAGRPDEYGPRGHVSAQPGGRTGGGFEMQF